jgi:hypothetical protein
MARTRVGRFLGLAMLAACAGVSSLSPAWAQGVKAGGKAGSPPSIVTVEQPDAQRTRGELSELLQRYPPSLRGALALDPSLLSNESYLAPYPALLGYLNNHPEIARNPSFYIGDSSGSRPPSDRDSRLMSMWNDILTDFVVFIGLGMAIGLLVWLTRTLIDYRRWSRLAKVQTDVHTKILDRFTANDDLLAYIQSPAGSKFLESSPIKLDAGPRGVGAPLARILWSMQGGVVLVAGGIGLLVVSGRVANDVSQAIQALGVLGTALGLGFVISAVISFVISRKLGLIEPPPPAPPRLEQSSMGGLGNLK